MRRAYSVYLKYSFFSGYPPRIVVHALPGGRQQPSMPVLLYNQQRRRNSMTVYEIYNKSDLKEAIGRHGDDGRFSDDALGFFLDLPEEYGELVNVGWLVSAFIEMSPAKLAENYWPQLHEPKAKFETWLVEYPALNGGTSPSQEERTEKAAALISEHGRFEGVTHLKNGNYLIRILPIPGE
jgi:hypothetical protein